MIDQDQLNNDITRWSKDSLKAAKAEIGSLGIKHYPNSPNPVPLATALKSQARKQFGMINRISYKFPRSGVFVHKGVSRGHPASNPRKAKPWFGAIDSRIEDLADIVSNGQANIVVNNLSIR
jgi:hypothetical protein